MMQALDLDFARPTRSDRRQGAPLLVAAIFAALCMLLWRSELQHEVQELESRVGALEQPGGEEAAVRRNDPALLEEMRQAHDVIEQVALPWDRLFRAVEGAALEGVTLLGIAPDVRTGVMQLRAETTDAETMFEYARRLEQQPELAEVYLLEHRYQRDRPARPLQFALTATWMEKAP